MSSSAPDQASPPAGRERRVLAILFALLLGPGAGHLLYGRYWRGLLWAALVWSIVIAGFWVTPWLFLVGLAVILGAIVDAALIRPAARGLPAWVPVLALCLGLTGVHQALRIGVKMYHVEMYRIPSGAMMPTLQIGDHIMVRKARGKARRGEIVVFIYPMDESKDFIKRVVAVGGDTVEVRGRDLLLNGRPIPRRALSGPCTYPDAAEDGAPVEQRPCEKFEEELDGRRYQIIHDPNAPSTDRKPTRVPEGHMFVVGDNRDNSHDSRFWGTVPLANVKGRAVKVLWSRSAEEGMRWDRVNVPIH